MTSPITLPTISKNQFSKRLKKRPYENIELIKLIENYLIKNRGYVFKMPPPNTPVILLSSGGLDSTITWEILLSKYHLKIYPLFLTTKNTTKQQVSKSVDYFDTYFQKKYPNLNQPLMKFSTHLLPPEIEKTITNPSLLHPEQLFTAIQSKFSGPYSKSPLPPMQIFYALLYAQYLSGRYHISIKTIFNGVTAKDGLVVPGQTLTSLRIGLLNLITTDAQSEWQFSSPIFENKLNHWLTKTDLIKIANQFHLPLKKTWSCYANNRFHCGLCQSCCSRQTGFKLAKITDPNKYAFTLIPQNIKNLPKTLYNSIKLNLGIKKAINQYFKPAP